MRSTWPRTQAFGLATSYVFHGRISGRTEIVTCNEQVPTWRRQLESRFMTLSGRACEHPEAIYVVLTQ